MKETEFDYRKFVVSWESDWNSHDLDRILSHYTDDVVFRSQKAVPHVGTGVLYGKSALREYWSKALSSQPDLKFTVERYYVGYGMIAITYTNHRSIHAVETLVFDKLGQVVEASACHEVEL